MAQAFPRRASSASTITCRRSSRRAKAADAAGVADRVTFEVAAAKEFPGGDYDLVAFFDCLHDMGDPVGAAAHVRAALAPDGTWLIVEPFAHDRLADNLNPVGRIYYAASTMICTPASLSQEVGLALGAQAGEAAAARSRDRRRLHPLPPRNGNAVQPGAGSSSLVGEQAP